MESYKTTKKIPNLKEKLRISKVGNIFEKGKDINKEIKLLQDKDAQGRCSAQELQKINTGVQKEECDFDYYK